MIQKAKAEPSEARHGMCRKLAVEMAHRQPAPSERLFETRVVKLDLPRGNSDALDTTI
jgi:hypothetical protein